MSMVTSPQPLSREFPRCAAPRAARRRFDGSDLLRIAAVVLIGAMTFCAEWLTSLGPALRPLYLVGLLLGVSSSRVMSVAWLVSAYTALMLLSGLRGIDGPDGEFVARRGIELFALWAVAYLGWRFRPDREAADAGGPEGGGLDRAVELVARLDEAAQRTHEYSVLHEMSECLQSSSSVGEVRAVVGSYSRRLFPGAIGTLLLLHKPYAHLAPEWRDGESGARETERTLQVDECWALRRGKPHWVADPRAGLPCAHAESAREFACACLPMIAHGEAIGILHLQFAPSADIVDASCAERRIRTLVTLAEATAGQIGLSLANLKSRETLRTQSIKDPLTGLYNRRYLDEVLERETARALRSKSSIGLIMLDIDHFKQFNDSYGHGAGDLLLATIGRFLAARARRGDICCRLGGEEFGVVMPDSTVELARHRAEQLRGGIGKMRVDYRGYPLGTITCSAGVAAFPTHGQSWEGVFQQADAALYLAKASGRNRVAVAKPGCLPWIPALQ